MINFNNANYNISEDFIIENSNELKQYYTVKPITITGSCTDAMKELLAATANNDNVTY